MKDGAIKNGAAKSAKPTLAELALMLGEASANPDDSIIVDVRSPGEFDKGAISGAVNIPLFSNGERAEIGTLYKMLGKERAVDKGLEVMGERLTAFVRAFETYKSRRIIVYCARGGMRSASVTGLLKGLGYRADQLPGGYKAFRNYLLTALETRLPPRLIVIHGKTGVGKTLLLNRLDNALDLEGLARHRSSLFGAVNLQPRTQQQFEAHLLARLEGLDYDRPVWVEGESRKIGSVLMPDSLRKKMQQSPCVLVTVEKATRVARIVQEYGQVVEGHGNCEGREGSEGHQCAGHQGRQSEVTPETRDQLVAALHTLTAQLGKARVEDMARRVRDGDLASVVEELLDDHYDPRYGHSMRDYEYDLTLSSQNLDEAAEKLRAFARTLPAPLPTATDKADREADATGKDAKNHLQLGSRPS